MERAEFVAVLTPLVLGLRAEMDGPSWTVYHRALGALSLPLLQAAVETALSEDRRFFPTVPELRSLAERARVAVLAAHPYTGCIDCEDQIGFRGVLVNGVARVERCPCFERHLERLAALGVTTRPLTLPPAKEAREFARVGSDE